MIPVWNRWELTEACLDSIAAHTPEPHEIIVVDNASTDETPRRLAERDDIRVVTNATNLGFAGGINTGLAVADGRHVCILNNDTLVTEGWLSQMLAVASDPTVGIVGPRSNLISGLQVVPGAPELDELDEALAFAAEWHTVRRGLSWPLERLVGFCMLARGEVWEELGGLDEGVGIGNYEDDELCQRARGQGYNLRVADGSVVLHHGSATFDASDINARAAILTGARHVEDRHVPRAELATAVVLGDGDPATVAAALHHAWHVCDGATVLERRAPDSVAMAAAVGLRDVRVETVDWIRPDALQRSLARLTSRYALVLGAGEELVVEDHALARVELLRNDGRPLGIQTPNGPRIRAVAPGDGHLIEQPTDHVMTAARIRVFGSES